MAKNTGLIKFTGTLDGITGRHTAFGYVLQRPGGFKSERVKTEARYEKTRQLNSEFGRCAKLASLFKQHLDYYLKLLPDPYVYNHIQKWLSAVKECDVDTPKGDKTVSKGMLTERGSTLFNGFSFNRNRSFRMTAFENYQLDIARGWLALRIDPSRLDIPKNSDAAAVQLLLLRINFDGLDYKMGASEMLSIAKNNSASDECLEVSVPEGDGILVTILFMGYGTLERGTVVVKRDIGNMLGILGWVDNFLGYDINLL